MDIQRQEPEGMVSSYPALVVLLSTAGSDLRGKHGANRDTTYHGSISWLYGVDTIHWVSGPIIWNLHHEERLEKFPMGWILAIGILVQFGWEAALLLGGIRSAGIESWGDKLLTLIVNSLLETNLGMPYVYALFVLYTTRWTQQLKPREKKIKFLEAMRENNAKKVK